MASVSLGLYKERLEKPLSALVDFIWRQQMVSTGFLGPFSKEQPESWTNSPNFCFPSTDSEITRAAVGMKAPGKNQATFPKCLGRHFPSAPEDFRPSIPTGTTLGESASRAVRMKPCG